MNIKGSAFLMTIVHLALALIGMASANNGVLWRLLQVSYSRLSSGARYSGSHDIPATTSSRLRNTACSISCLQVEWCNLWCLDPSSINTCLFFDMFVVAGYQETNMADALTCFTRSPKDYAVGAAIEGAGASIYSTLRVKENLVDGIHDFGVNDECYSSGDKFNPFFKLDLVSVKPIRKIKMVLQHNSYVEYMYDLEVRVGIEDLSESDFGNYEFFGFFPGPSSPSEEIVFSYSNPMMARYVIVQRWSDTTLCNPDDSSENGKCYLQVCHIEIN